ncbi:lipopolysaccharide assembly protein LapA domain-containing protein [Marivivens marinus]|uniref:lipopolysaccharide assembly protein LapA domain-containing protein n=1 Tax=Marivivens marinus TaxID=3110173 RepID=UPI003B846BEC
MKTIRYAFWAIVALCLILVGLANREPTVLRAMPDRLAELLGISPVIELPLFVVLFLGVGLGLLIGFFWEWIREYRQRAEARVRARELEQLRREVARTRETEGKDDIIALLDGN